MADEYKLYRFSGPFVDGSEYIVGLSKLDALLHFLGGFSERYLESKYKDTIQIKIKEVDDDQFKISKRALEAIAKESKQHRG